MHTDDTDAQMSGLSPPTLKIPALSIQTSTSGDGPHRRARSGSLLKVEKVDSSTEEVLDQGAYANINAEWVNRKGESLVVRWFDSRVERGQTSSPVAVSCRRLAYTCRPHRDREGRHRYHPRHDAGN